MQTAGVLAAKRLLRAEGLGHLRRCLRSDVGWTKRHATLTAHPHLARYVALHHTVWRAAHAQVLALDEPLAPTAAPRGDALRRLQTIPGVSPIIALTALAVFSDATLFPSAKRAAGLCATRFPICRPCVKVRKALRIADPLGHIRVAPSKVPSRPRVGQARR